MHGLSALVLLGRGVRLSAASASTLLFCSVRSQSGKRKKINILSKKKRKDKRKEPFK